MNVFNDPGLPLVSVVIPTFNRPALLNRAVCSVLRQTFRSFEVIIVNDAGTDVQEALSPLASPQIRCLSHDINKGVAAARNTGIRASRGDYIAYLDDDDIYYPDHLQTLVTFLQQHGEYQVAYTDAYRAWQVEKDGELVTIKKDMPYSWDFDPDQILDSNYIPVICVMHRRTCLDEAGLFDESLLALEDLDLWIRMSRIYSFAHIPKITCEFSWREKSETLSNKHKDFADILPTVHKKYELHRKEAWQRRRIGELEAQVRQLESDAGAWQGRAKQLESDVGVWQARAKQLENDVQIWFDRAGELASKVQVLVERIGVLQSEAVAGADHAANLETRCEVLTRERDQVKAELERMASFPYWLRRRYAR